MAWVPCAEGKRLPKPHLLTLHNVHSMPELVKQAVIEKINATRQGPMAAFVICNMHLDLKDPIE